MTQLAPRTESFGAGDQSWLGSRHGVDVAKSVTLDPTDWSAKISDGRIKSGEPYALVAGLAIPYDAEDEVSEGVAGPAATLAGFVLTDQPVASGAGNVTFPGVWHGRIILSNLPSTVAADATQSGQFLLEA